MRKTSQRNWDNAVSKWKEDMEFVKSFDDKQFIQKLMLTKLFSNIHDIEIQNNYDI